MTLNEIAYDIITKHGKYRLGDEKYTDLLEVIKRSIKQRYALYIRRDVERNGGNEEYYQTITASLIKVDKSEAPCKPVGCLILRTANKITQPVRLKTTDLFKFVGSLDRQIIFTKTQLEELQFTFSNDFTANIPRYIYKDGYVYVFNRNHIKYVLIEGIFIDKVSGDLCNTGNNCDIIEADDAEYPIPADLIVSVESDILTEIVNS